ncbi:ferritin-like domain-containing protein [Pararobbsia silviterrae]|uniref:DUF455 family protein n=1 Tax=Pararobbsia silviterrae TaxID=1792498 RepID=A0A494XDV2_9BURK|nr:ferritin-like domain-containing protein [Pararobbsia silviterrae]RKP46646.1 DUF455 family protein [Pararobbsia silviterrae]
MEFNFDVLSGERCARALALSALALSDPGMKVDATLALREAADAGRVRIDSVRVLHDLADLPDLPGRPSRPELVLPRLLVKRSVHTEVGRAVLLHALAHIEFNAINLALDAVWRFAGMPDAYYADWLRVAAEEAYHFSLIRAHLASMGYAYGDFAAHNGLWEMVEKTCGDVLARMALVPRTLEARGLDAAPPMRAKLAQAGDEVAARILDIILRDEIGHVAVGNRWYRYLCAQRGADPHLTYAKLARQFKAPDLKGPFNVDARRLAGFTDVELDALVQADAQRGSAQVE